MAMPGETIRIQVIDSYKPSVLDTGTEGNFLYLLMPVRV
jgi:DNA polymerase III sliding clamp (beta) subunit (PCNA family)